MSTNGTGLNKISRQMLLDKMKEAQVTQVDCLFTDVLGRIMSTTTPVEKMSNALDHGVLIDGSSVEGFARIHESDLRGVPDMETFRVLPWEVGGQKVGVVFLDVVYPDGRPFEGDPRRVLKRILAHLWLQNRTVNIGPEAEFFLSRTAEKFEPVDQSGYFEYIQDSAGSDVRVKMIAALKQLGIEVEVGHHEVAPSQHEIDIRFCEALKMADQLQLHRLVVKTVARMNGLHATFMPKPMAGVNGSGMHIHNSVFHETTNLFFDKSADDWYNLSVVGRLWLAGLLKYTPELTLVFNQWFNSYRRLVPGFEAPVYVCWGNKNRSALVRKPGYEPGREQATRLELRSPDPACNPYLAFACIIAAGMEGVKDNVMPPKPVEIDVYHLSAEKLAKLGISRLPADMAEAIALFRHSRLARETLGEHAFEKFLANKEQELERFRLEVTDIETRMYFGTL